MAEEAFELGAIVRLKSGGQHMTYEAKCSPEYGDCVWFNGKKFERERIAFAALELVPDDDDDALGIVVG